MYVYENSKLCFLHIMRMFCKQWEGTGVSCLTLILTLVQYLTIYMVCQTYKFS